MFCNKCGKQMSDEHAFCMNCGKPKVIVRKKSKLPIIIIAIVAVIVILVMLVCAKPNYDFMRGTSWGMSMNSVQEIEEIELKLAEQSQEDIEREELIAQMLGIEYIQKERLQGYIDDFEMYDEDDDLYLTYTFIDDELISISVAIQDLKDDGVDLMEKYSQNYGQTEVQENGYSCLWTNSNATIELSFITENCMIVTYTDITYES